MPFEQVLCHIHTPTSCWGSEGEWLTGQVTDIYRAATQAQPHLDTTYMVLFHLQ